MPDWLAIVLRPVVMLVLLLVAHGISRWLRPFIPAGRFKTRLYTRNAIVPDTQRSNAEQWFWRALLIAIAVLILFKPLRYL